MYRKKISNLAADFRPVLVDMLVLLGICLQGSSSLVEQHLTRCREELDRFWAQARRPGSKGKAHSK